MIDDTMLCDNWKDDATEFIKFDHPMFASRTTRMPNKMVTNAPDGSGAEAWRVLNEEESPCLPERDEVDQIERETCRVQRDGETL